MIRVLGAVAAAYVGYSLGNVVKHQSSDASSRRALKSECLVKARACDEVDGVVPGETEEAEGMASRLEGSKDAATSPCNVQNADDGEAVSAQELMLVEQCEEESLADGVFEKGCSFVIWSDSGGIDAGTHGMRSGAGGELQEIGDEQESEEGISSGMGGCRLGFSEATVVGDKEGEKCHALGASEVVCDKDMLPGTPILEGMPGKVGCFYAGGSEEGESTSKLLEVSPGDDLLESGVHSESIGFRGEIKQQDTDESTTVESESACSQVDKGPADFCPLIQQGAAVGRIQSQGSVLESRDQTNSGMMKQSHYMEVFQKEWVSLLHNERDKHRREVEVEKKSRMLERLYVKTFEKEWIQRLEVERDQQHILDRKQRDDRMVEEQEKRLALSQCKAENHELREELAQIVYLSEQEKAEAEDKIHDFELLLANLESEILAQRELLAQSGRKMQEITEQERAAAEARLKDLCLLLGKVEAENVRLKDVNAEANKKIEDAKRQADACAEANAKIRELQQELTEMIADRRRHEERWMDLGRKMEEVEREKVAINAALEEAILNLEEHRVAWNKELDSKLEEARKVEQAKLEKQMRADLEEEKLACKKLLEEIISRENAALQSKWLAEMKSHKEGLTTILVEETKKKILEERENWKSAQEVEWKKRLDQEREQQLLLQEEKDRERKLVDERIRKEGARLELRLSSIGARERDVEEKKVAVLEKERELKLKLREVEMFQSKVNLREKLLSTTNDDSFNEDNFQRWISLRLGRRQGTVFWYSTGELYEYPSGDMLVKVEGVEVTRAVVVGQNKVHQVSRKVFLFRDKDTNELLAEFNGDQVMPLIYHYQKLAYSLKGNQLLTEASNGQGDQLTPLRGQIVSLQHMKNTTLLVFTSPVFVNVQTVKGYYQSYENYDYYMDKTDEDLSNHCTMVRFGSTPPFADNAVMHMNGWRLDSFDLLPKSMKDYIEAQNPEWKEAPLG